MVERRPLMDLLAHAVMLMGVLIVAFPLYLAFVASTHTAQDIVQAPMPQKKRQQNQKRVLLAR